MSSATSAPPDPAFLELLVSVLKTANEGTGGAAPVPPPHAPAAPAPAAAGGRDSRGRFTRYNPGGPGNPFARRVATLRRALLERVSEEDVCAVADRLVERARGGDVAAARLLLAYAIGKPAESVNPDTLDRQEWELYRQAPATDEEFLAVFAGLPLPLACKFARLSLPLLHYQRAQELAQMLDPPSAKPAESPAPEGAKAPRRKRRKPPASEPAVPAPLAPPDPAPPVLADCAGQAGAGPVAEVQPEPAVVLPMPCPPATGPAPTDASAGRAEVGQAAGAPAEPAVVLPLPSPPVAGPGAGTAGHGRTPAPSGPLFRSGVASAACAAADKPPRPCAQPLATPPDGWGDTDSAKEGGLRCLLRALGLTTLGPPSPNGGNPRAVGPTGDGEGE